MLITSRANERVKQLRALRNHRERDATASFLAEGARLVQAALDHEAGIEVVVAAPERLSPQESALLEQMEARGLPRLEVSGEVFDSFSFREEQQAIAVVAQQRYEKLLPSTRGQRCWVALQDVQHPGNLGTIIRCCDADRKSVV